MPGIPKWAAEPLRRYLNQSTEICKVLGTTIYASHAAITMPRILHATPKMEPDQTPKGDVDETMEKFASFAAHEKERGFPVLHAHASVILWGFFQASIEDLLAAFLMNEPERLRTEPFARIRIPLAEFEGSEREERMQLLITELKRSANVSRRHGLDRIEALLEPFGFSGPVHDLVKKEVCALDHIRNVIVHRACLVDRRLADACPWLNLKIGEPVIITHTAFKRYDSALTHYLGRIMERVAAHFGKPFRALPEGTQESEESIFNNTVFFHFLHDH